MYGHIEHERTFMKGIVFFTAKNYREKNRIKTSEKWEKTVEQASHCMYATEKVLEICSKNPEKFWHLNEIQQKTKVESPYKLKILRNGPDLAIQDHEIKCIVNALVQYELLEEIVDVGPYATTISYKYKYSKPGPGWLRKTFAFVTTGLVAYCFYANYRGKPYHYTIIRLLGTPIMKPIAC